MQQIKSFGILQTAKVSGVMYLIVSAVFAIPFAVIGALGAVVSGKPEGLLMLLLILAPLLYAVMGALFAALGCLVYNLVAARIGGVEVELQ